ncbi:MAG: hypothetical protein ACFCUP_14810 [Actinomycetales bacterium]
MITKTATLLAAMSLAAVAQAPSASADEWPVYGHLWVASGELVRVKCMNAVEGVDKFYEKYREIPVRDRHKSDIRSSAPREFDCFVQ